MPGACTFMGEVVVRTFFMLRTRDVGLNPRLVGLSLVHNKTRIVLVSEEFRPYGRAGRRKIGLQTVVRQFSWM